MAGALFPFTEGKFAKLFQPRQDASPREDVYAVCYDFMHLTEHRDFAALALRLCVYEIRRFAARMSRRRHRTFLVLDESWALLDTGVSGGVASTAGPFLSSSVRMGRKEGMSVVGLALLGKHAESVVCHGSGRIREELISRYGSPFALETAT
jgi:hypothetical protein